MKNLFLTFLIALLFSMPGYSLTLESSVEYTVDSARVVAFQDTNITIPASEFNNDIFDIFYYANYNAVKNASNSAGYAYKRKLVPFYIHNKLIGYGVESEEKPNKKFYYSSKGHLIKYEVDTHNKQYPYKTIAYDTKGNLLNISLNVSAQESFIFDSNKNLIGHWLNNKCYNEAGKEIITRRLP